MVGALLSSLTAGALGLAATAGQAAAPTGDAPVAVVRDGDTLWRIATREFPEREPYEVIDAIRRLNGIDDYTVHAGQHLRLPTLR